MLGTLSAPHHCVLRCAQDDPYECRQTLVRERFSALWAASTLGALNVGLVASQYLDRDRKIRTRCGARPRALLELSLILPAFKVIKKAIRQPNAAGRHQSERRRGESVAHLLRINQNTASRTLRWLRGGRPSLRTRKGSKYAHSSSFISP
jgi:hypothetical protein